MVTVDIKLVDLLNDDTIFKSDDSKEIARAISEGQYSGFINPGEKKRWVEWLRSGMVDQARGNMCILRSDGSLSFCILGVWVEKVIGFPLVPVNSGNPYSTTVNAAEAARLLVENIGDKPLDNFRENKKQNLKVITFLHDLNDSGVPFDTLADIIEKYL